MDVAFFNSTTTAHFLMGLFFVFFGFWNIYNWKTVCQRIPCPLLFLCIVFQLVLGTFLIFGIYVKFTALLSALFLIIVALTLHPFWRFEGELRRLHLILFVAYFTIVLGGLMLLALPIDSVDSLFVCR